MSNYTASSVNNISKILHETFILRETQINVVASSKYINKLVCTYVYVNVKYNHKHFCIPLIVCISYYQLKDVCIA